MQLMQGEGKHLSGGLYGYFMIKSCIQKIALILWFRS